MLLPFYQVTQRFFETVSTQLERWYERKIVEVEQQTEFRAQQDRKELLQRISMLEEELRRLKTDAVINTGEGLTENGDIFQCD